MVNTERALYPVRVVVAFAPAVIRSVPFLLIDIELAVPTTLALRYPNIVSYPSVQRVECSALHTSIREAHLQLTVDTLSC